MEFTLTRVCRHQPPLAGTLTIPIVIQAKKPFRFPICDAGLLVRHESWDRLWSRLPRLKPRGELLLSAESTCERTSGRSVEELVLHGRVSTPWARMNVGKAISKSLRVRQPVDGSFQPWAWGERPLREVKLLLQRNADLNDSPQHQF